MISVVLCCRNESHSILRAVEAVEQQARGLDEPVEVIVACNRSTDGTERLVRTLPHTRILLDRNHHSGVLHNIALEHCRGEIVLFLDGDMVIGRGSLARVGHVLRDPGLTGVSGYKWLDIDGAPAIDRIRDLEYHAKSGKASLHQPALISLDRAYTVTGGLFAVRREALCATGGYDPSFRRYACEDIYVETRLLNMGCRLCYDPAIQAEHVHKHASAREFVWRGYAGSPRGLAHLLQRCAELGMRLPFDGYVMQVPVHTTGLLLVGLTAWAAGWRYGGPLLLAGVASQIADLVPFFTSRPGRYPLRIRVAAAGFWMLTNLGRLLFCAALAVRRFAPATVTEVVAGTVERPGRAAERIERRVAYRAPRPGPLAFRVRLGVVLAGLWWSMLQCGWRACAGALAARQRGWTGRPAAPR